MHQQQQPGRVFARADDTVKDTSIVNRNPSPVKLQNWFTYHAPDGFQVQQYAALRDAGLVLGILIADLVPDSAIDDRLAALRLLREAIMTANAGIACGGALDKAEAGNQQQAMSGTG